MIENSAKVMALIEKMEANLPIPARPTSAVVRLMKAQGVRIARNKELPITKVFYMGDEGGIMCDVTPPGMNNPVVCSLTQIRVSPKHPLANEIRAYQKERKKYLAQPGQSGQPGAFTIRPRKKRGGR